jgi:hypothetical protein
VELKAFIRNLILMELAPPTNNDFIDRLCLRRLRLRRLRRRLGLELLCV